MDAADRIAELFDRLVSIGQDRVSSRPYAEQVVYFVVAARCEKDIGGFESVWEQGFEPAELNVLIDGLRRLGEAQLADDFSLGLEMLDRDGFYGHRNLNLVSPVVREQLVEMGERIGDQLWALDEKLVAFVWGSP